MYERPGCVTAYAILFGIAAVVSCMAGFFLLANSRDGVQGLSSIVFAAVIAALYFVIARGLWLLRNWARIVVIVLQVLSVLGILSQLSNNSSGLVLIVAVFGLAIAAYILYWFASHGEYFE
jgi:FtsH-binding integral membrane protein